MAVEIKDWSMQINVEGEQLFKPGTADKFQDGPCEVTIVETWQEPGKKNDDGSPKGDNIVFVVEASKGPDKGKKIRRYLSAAGLQMEPGSIQRKEWKNLLSCVAKDPAALEKGNITVKPATFLNKTAYILVQNPAEGATYQKADGSKGKAFANVNFITKDMVAELAAKPGAAKPAAGGAAGAKTFEVDAGGAKTPQPGEEADALE